MKRKRSNCKYYKICSDSWGYVVASNWCKKKHIDCIRICKQYKSKKEAGK